MTYDSELLSRIVLKNRIDDHEARIHRIELQIARYGLKPEQEDEPEEEQDENEAD